ncbi:MAG TPA: serine/threonine-protein kinase [Phycisphaerae bacterium]|nr:serine/threonine-protein kinase [Phycisphaerae bacterium]
MTPDQYQRVKELFTQALNRPANERAAWLADEAADDADVFREVREMLAEESNPNSAAKQLDAGAASMLDDSPTMPERIGKYRIVGLKGHGGMGIVYEAEQDSPKRRVALKVIRTPMVSPQLLARFKREAEVLGKLQHAGIAHIYEAAISQDESGEQPFLAMELIQGERITAYAKAHNLSTRHRLELVARVCDAVQHAHQRGIIHRDLKPANILVVEPESSLTGSLKSTSRIADAVGQPKVLDFGVARLVEGDASIATLQTEVGQLIGTLAYMSPEQVTGDSSSLDTRCDIYALGVLLFELLSGQLPHDLQNCSIAQAARIIQEEEPTKLSEAGAQLRGDLETIVAKALEKDREHRYQSASEMAADLRRFLADEPIVARPASAVYQFRKFARRNKGLVTGLGVALVVLILGVTGTVFGLLSALQANRELADTNRKLEESNTDLKNVSQFQSDQLTGIDAAGMALQLRSDLLSGIPQEERSTFESLVGDVNFVDYARSTLEHNFFDRAVKSVESQFEDQPLLQATLLQDLATTMRELGLLDSAVAPQERSLAIRRQELGDEHYDSLASLGELGNLQLSRGEFEEAESRFRQILEGYGKTLGESARETSSAAVNLALVLQRLGRNEEAEELARTAYNGLSKAYGPNDIDTLHAMATLASIVNFQGRYEEAEKLARETLQRRREVLGDDNSLTAASMLTLATVLGNQGAYEEALKLTREAFEVRSKLLGAEHPKTLATQMEIGTHLTSLAKLEEAEPILRDALEKRRHVLGKTHYDTINSVDSLASLLEERGLYAEAESLFRESLEGRRRTLGNDHPATLRALGNLGFMLSQEGKAEEAEPLYRETLAGLRRVYGNDHPHTLTSIGNLAALLSGLGKHEEALPLYHESLEGRRRLLGDDHPSTLNAIYNMGDMLLRQGKLDQAEGFCKEAYEGYQRVGGDDHIGTLYSLTLMGQLRMAQDNPAEAETFLETAVERRRRVNGDDHPETLGAVLGLADALEAQNDWTDAEQWRRFVIDAATRNHPDDGTRRAGALCALGHNLLRQNRPTEAEASLSEGLSLYKDSDQSESWPRWNAQGLLAEAISADPNRYAEAEPLLLECAEQLASALEENERARSRVAEARLRLADLYRAWGKRREETKWRSLTGATD